MSHGRPFLTRQEHEPSDPDIGLIVKVREGDPAAVALLWSRHFPSACGAARRITDCSDPSGAASEAFLAAVRAIRSGHGPAGGSFRAYICSLATRLAVRDAVRRSVLEHGEVHQDSIPTAKAHTPTQGELHPNVIGGWDQLPERWHHVLWLTGVERRTPADVAEKVGMTASAVAAMAYRARWRLRDLELQGEYSANRNEPLPFTG
ncbi:MAG TPA: sigma-70 family RNA polymerase sigma factor [Acidimicrobiales bacterium]|jgi:DNA-directed RNA polymerase specialized sigma24 family protein|nr:sigma-70 family RNA polymerase sigma factor [Acidimicrobiales bacterium]